MAAPGDVALVLHTHLPYVRNHGVWPVGEQWLFEAWGQAWLPTTQLLLTLAEEGHRDVLTLAVTPVAAHQVADRRLRRDLGTWLASQMWQSEEQRLAYDGPDHDAVRSLAPFHWRHFARLLEIHERVEAAGGLLAVWADLQGAGVIELLAGPATHPYLPLLADPTLVDAQLASGLASHAIWA
ncbi:MAG: 1,4-alpha-glucan branching protein, partial [Nitriliruptorales bacterium]